MFFGQDCELNERGFVKEGKNDVRNCCLLEWLFSRLKMVI